MSKEYGKNISPILEEIADSLWEIDARDNQEPYEYSDEAFASALKIMMSVSMDILWKNQEKDNTPFNIRKKQATKLGEDLAKLISDNLNIDTKKLYELKKK